MNNDNIEMVTKHNLKYLNVTKEGKGIVLTCDSEFVNILNESIKGNG